MSIEKLKRVINKEFTNDIDFINGSIKKLNLNKNSRLLDIGTGFGIMAIILTINGFEVLTGEPEEDFETKKVEHHAEHHHKHHGGKHGGFEYNWRENAKAIGVEQKIKYQHFDAQKLPFPNESFDGIFLYDALQHIKDRKLALEECIRVLKPEGIISIIETNKKGIEYYQKTEGFIIDYVDPRELISQDSIFFDLIEGELLNCYILKKKKLH